jgi:hypothetical protein
MTRLTLRLPETLHHQLEALAQQEKVSLNQYLVYALTRQVASVYEVTAVSPEKVRQQREQLDALLRNTRSALPAEIARAMAAREQVPPEPDLDPELVRRLRYRINEARPEYQTDHTDA